MLRKKKCTDCKAPKLHNEFNLDRHKKDGHRSKCRACEKQINYYKLPRRGRKQFESRVSLYRVIYDPLDSFGLRSEFTRQEISVMLRGDEDGSFLAIGTRFRRGDKEYRVNDDLRLMRETAGVAG